MNATLTCVYCGHAYPPGTPAHGAPVLTEHIRACEKHPLREAEETIAMLVAALVGLVGESCPAKLRGMELVMRSLPAPEEDKAVTINAIHALLRVAGE